MYRFKTSISFSTRKCCKSCDFVELTGKKAMRSKPVEIGLNGQRYVTADQQFMTTVRREVQYGESGLWSNTEFKAVKSASAVTRKA